MFLFPALVLKGQTIPSTNKNTPSLLPPYGKLPPTFWEEHGTTIITAGFVVLALMALAIWMRLRPRPPVILSTAAQARHALEALRNQPEDGALLSEVSAILQKYFIAAFELSPGEFTTTEFCEAIAGREHIGGELLVQVAAFLRKCDERKFAPANPAPPLDAVSRALELVALAEGHRTQPQQPMPVQSRHAASIAK